MASSTMVQEQHRQNQETNIPSNLPTTSQGSKMPSSVPARFSLYKTARKFVGFQDSRRFAMWLALSGVWVLFLLYMMTWFLDYDGAYKLHSFGSGEWFTFRQGLNRLGLQMHLAMVLPAGVLAVFQFLPVTQRKYKTFHKFNGYLASALLVLGNPPALFIGPSSFGGSVSLQTGIYALAMSTSYATYKGITTIRKMQLDEHRAWMIRTWAYAGSILSVRPILGIVAVAASLLGNFYAVMECNGIAFTVGEERSQSYLTCRNDANAYTVVRANIASPHAEEVIASLRLSFSSGIWLALVIHAVVAEVYLHYTPAEAKRLRDISMSRQIKAGLIPAAKEVTEKGYVKELQLLS